MRSFVRHHIYPVALPLSQARATHQMQSNVPMVSLPVE